MGDRYTVRFEWLDGRAETFEDCPVLSTAEDRWTMKASDGRWITVMTRGVRLIEQWVKPSP
jgi:hypothetical protein